MPYINGRNEVFIDGRQTTRAGKGLMMALVAERIDLILTALEILPLQTRADRQYATIRHHLTRQGTPVGPNDLLIAAHALANDLTVITANVGEFSRVPGLKVENWLQA